MRLNILKISAEISVVFLWLPGAEWQGPNENGTA